jgi:hypothetical protein
LNTSPIKRRCRTLVVVRFARKLAKQAPPPSRSQALNAKQSVKPSAASEPSSTGGMSFQPGISASCPAPETKKASLTKAAFT